MHPSIKDEITDYRKCFVMRDGKLVLSHDGQKIALAHPRWRSILIQATVDHIVQWVLYKPHSKAEVVIEQDGSIADAVSLGSPVGVSTSDETLYPKPQTLQTLPPKPLNPKPEELCEFRGRGNCRIRSSDVSGIGGFEAL